MNHNAFHRAVRHALSRQEGEYIETEKYHTGTYTTGSTAKTYIVGGELYPPENHTAFVRN